MLSHVLGKSFCQIPEFELPLPLTFFLFMLSLMLFVERFCKQKSPQASGDRWQRLAGWVKWWEIGIACERGEGSWEWEVKPENVWEGKRMKTCECCLSGVWESGWVIHLMFSIWLSASLWSYLFHNIDLMFPFSLLLKRVTERGLNQSIGLDRRRCGKGLWKIFFVGCVSRRNSGKGRI